MLNSTIPIPYLFNFYFSSRCRAYSLRVMPENCHCSSQGLDLRDQDQGHKIGLETKGWGRGLHCWLQKLTYLQHIRIFVCMLSVNICLVFDSAWTFWVCCNNNVFVPFNVTALSHGLASNNSFLRFCLTSTFQICRCVQEALNFCVDIQVVEVKKRCTSVVIARESYTCWPVKTLCKLTLFYVQKLSLFSTVWTKSHRVTGHLSTPPENWTVRAFLQLTPPRLSNDFTAAWLTFTFPQLFAVAATLKSIDYNVAMTFILNNNNNKILIKIFSVFQFLFLIKKNCHRLSYV